jgi:hypothetical protein
LKHLRRLMFFPATADILLLFDCFWGGSMANGRLEIPDSMFFRNASDLSLQLIIGVTQFLFLLYERRSGRERCLGMAVALIFMLETGARSVHRDSALRCRGPRTRSPAHKADSRGFVGRRSSRMVGPVRSLSPFDALEPEDVARSPKA